MDTQTESLKPLLEGVARATQVLITKNDYVDAINEALRIIGKANELDSVFLFENHNLPGEETACSLRFVWRSDNKERSHIEQLQFRSYEPSWYDRLSTGNPIHVVTEQSPQNIKEELEGFDLKSLLVIPVIAYEEFWGFLGIGSKNPQRTYSELEETSLEAIAGTLVSFFESKRNEKAFLESERRFQQIFQNNPAMKLVIDPYDGRIIDASESTGIYYGYSYEKLLGLTIYELTEENNERVKQFLKSAIRHQRSHFEFTHQKSDATSEKVEMLTSPVYLNGTTYIFAILNVVSQTGIISDATNSDALLDRFIRYTHVAAAVIDSDKRYCYASNRWKSYFSLEDNNWRQKQIFYTMDNPPEQWVNAVDTAIEGEVVNGVKALVPQHDAIKQYMRLDSYPWYGTSGTIKGVILFVDYITSSQMKLDDQFASNGHQQSQGYEYNAELEEERRNLARELHDGLGQILSATHYNVEMLENTDPADSQNFQQQITRIKQLLSNSINEVRTISNNLRPTTLDDFGLTAALNNLVQNYQSSTRINLNFQSFDYDDRLSDDIETTLYRICQEALNNIIRHSNANEANIELFKRNEEVSLMIFDNGDGIPNSQIPHTGGENDLPPDGSGLLNMRDRVNWLNGKFQIDSNPEKGTQILIEIPLPESIGTSTSY